MDTKTKWKDTDIKIRLKLKTANRLKKLSNVGDTYDSIINRLLDKPSR